MKEAFRRERPSDVRPGFWIVFEGGDSVGKTTQIRLLTRSLQRKGRRTLSTREPGGTELGDALRSAVMHGEHVDARAEALLYAADRAQHVSQIVLPALSKGFIVLQDRYIDSSVVYQGMARGLGAERIEQMSLWATDHALPDLVIVLDRDPMVRGREQDRIERELSDKADTIREGFLHRAGLYPDGQCVVIDAGRSIEEVSADVERVVFERIESMPTQEKRRCR